MELPRDYNKRLQRAYSDCRMRWSERREAWQLERRADFARTDLNPEKYPRDAVDTFIRRRDGFYLTGEYPANGLPPIDRLIAFLHSQDPVRLGLDPAKAVEEAARIASAIEDRERASRAKTRYDNSYEGSGAGAELYDQLAWEEGRRSAVPANYAFGSGPCAPSPNERD